MKVVKPRDRNEFRKIIEDAKRDGKLIYISAYPCPECEIFESALEELKVDTSKIVKVDVPNEDWAVEFVLNDLGVSGSPSIIYKDKVIDDFDPIELARKVKSIIEKGSV